MDPDQAQTLVWVQNVFSFPEYPKKWFIAVVGTYKAKEVKTKKSILQCTCVYIYLHKVLKIVLPGTHFNFFARQYFLFTSFESSTIFFYEISDILSRAMVCSQNKDTIINNTFITQHMQKPGFLMTWL